MRRPTIPIQLVPGDRPCLVVGGGAVAARKVRWLLDASAVTRVVAETVGGEVRALTDSVLDGRETPAGEPARLVVEEGPYDARDVEGCALVVAATDDPDLNARVAEDARSACVPVNVVDDPDMCDFFVPATARRGLLSVAVGTSGASPALAGEMRRAFDDLLPAGLGVHVSALGRVRDELATGAGERSDVERTLRRLGTLERALASESVDEDASVRAMLEEALGDVD